MTNEYNYQKEKKVVFTDKGQREFLKVRDKANELLAASGAVMAGYLMIANLGDSFAMMACIDRLVELKELREIPTNGCWQYRIFVKGQGLHEV